jgi:mycothiol synthase
MDATRIPTRPADGSVSVSVRPYAGEQDVPDFVRILNAEYEADGIDKRLTEEGERAWLAARSERFDPQRDVLFAELNGRPVGVAVLSWADSRDGSTREYRVWGAVEPAARRRGIGSALLADNERHAIALARTHDTDRPRIFRGLAAEGRLAGRVLERAGFIPEGYLFEMVRPSLDRLAEPPLPFGLRLRPVTRDQYPAVWRAHCEAFRDHSGGLDESETAMRRFLEAPHADPILWLIVWDRNEVAGGVINAVYPARNDALGIKRGYLDSVFTRRPWRRRGLAKALIARSLRLLRERGMTSAGLSVDARNRQGALGLYEAAGFRVHDCLVTWRKPLTHHPGLGRHSPGLHSGSV